MKIELYKAFHFKILSSTEGFEALALKVGQKVYLLARPPYIVLIPIPDNVDEALAEILGDIAYSREERKIAEEQLLKEAS